MAYWLVKTEPESYSLDDLQRAGRDIWDGVRNATAQKHIRQMAPGDQVLVYHTGNQRAVVGAAEVVTAPYPDPTAADGRSAAVDLAFRYRFARPVTLAAIKADPTFADWELVRISRLSVMPAPAACWQAIQAMAGNSVPT